MKALPISLIALAIVLIAISTVHSSNLAPATSPDRAVQNLFNAVKNHDWDHAYAQVAPSSNVDENSFIRDLAGRDGSLRTYSALQDVKTKVLNENDGSAQVRADLEWSTAVGA